jgi:5-formyltetrahydrofolate cyclo-ligase
MVDKKKLRTYFLQKRLQISSEQLATKSANLVNSLLQFAREGDFQDIFLFSPIKNEPDLLNLERYHNLTCLPVVGDSGTMSFYKWQEQDILKKSSQGILEPDPSKVKKNLPSDKTLVCVPALAVSHCGQRLGYGGGYYDRFMKLFPQATYVVTLFSEFITETLPSDHWDEKAQIVCCDLGVRYLK